MTLTSHSAARATPPGARRGKALALTGVNLAGADFGEKHLRGEHGTHYGYPSPADVDYFVGRGMNTIRLPFRWERLQREQFAEFHPEEFERLDALVRYTTKQGAYVILDPHNYARYYGAVIGTGDVPNSAFADFWTRLAETYKDDPRVIFGLINEPYHVPSTEHWVATANEAIAAIRATGATNLILVPGVSWSGAHSWLKDHYGTPNGVAMLEIKDPADRCAFDVHQYFDDDSSGTSDVIHNDDPQIGVKRIEAITGWLKEHGHRAFLGEFALANRRIGEGVNEKGQPRIGGEVIDNLLDYMEANSDVWLGFAWWAAGPRWGGYMYSIQPKNLGQPDQQDLPGMLLLEPHLRGVGDGEPEGL